MRSRFVAHCLAIFATSSFAPTLLANSFSCTDASGRTLFGSSPPAGCVGQMCETKPNGATECTPPPESADQRRKRENAEKKKHDCDAQFQQQQLAEISFLDRYPYRESIESERDQKLADNQRDIRAEEKFLDDLHSESKELGKKAEFFNGRHPMPEDLRADMDANRSATTSQESLVSKLKDQTRAINETYDQMAARRENFLQRGVAPFACK